ncbi:MAG: 3-isopropylmalate dehydratase small subunit, partial [Kiritimatiellales bacterium]|nr:3-isopropylmalate dehydratase small subunit [Kiritimatiellales bacterium]
EYLKSIQRSGFGPAHFSVWRYNADGSDNPGFILNQPKTKGATILIGRNNIGCGSSREHAVWAVAQQGFKVVIAPAEGEVPGFADIFRNNCAKNGVLTIQLNSTQVDEIFAMAENDEPLSATVSLEDQTVIFQPAGGDKKFDFEVDPSVKEKLLMGLDDIAESLLFEGEIGTFETGHDNQLLNA